MHILMLTFVLSFRLLVPGQVVNFNVTVCEETRMFKLTWEVRFKMVYIVPIIIDVL